MFFHRKRLNQKSKENETKELKEKLNFLIAEIKNEKNSIEEMKKEIQGIGKEVQEAGKEIGKEMQEVGKEVQSIGKEVSKHNMTLEDTLDGLEQQSEEEKESREQLFRLKKEQEQLLLLIGAYEEQIWNMKNFAGEYEEAFGNQLELMQRVLKSYRLPCGISMITEPEGKVDYQLHEVIEVIDTAEDERDQTVARIYSPGYLYKGRVVKKAKVAVYKVVTG